MSTKSYVNVRLRFLSFSSGSGQVCAACYLWNRSRADSLLLRSKWPICQQFPVRVCEPGSSEKEDERRETSELRTETVVASSSASE